MKVTIGPYKNWFGPYQIAELIPFISEETADNIGAWLDKTWISSLCKRIHDWRGERNIKIRIDKWDTWSMDNTLALIILPMLKQLKATKQGSPLVDLDDLPPHMCHTFKKSEDDWDTEDPWVHYKWEWVINEMIWTFEQLLDDQWESKYVIEEGELDFDEYPEDEGKDVTPVRWKKHYVVNWEGRQAHLDRIDNGLRLFGKYFRSLWD